MGSSPSGCATRTTGLPEELDREFQVTAGLANLRLLWDKRNKKLRLGF